MSEIDEILNRIPMDQLAGMLGVGQSQAEQAARAALPALLGGMQANAADPAGAASLAGALKQHDPSLLGEPLDKVDTTDGEKIVQNVFGDNTPDVMSALGGIQGGGGANLMQSLLPMLAPLVMSFLAGKMGGGLGSIFGGGSRASVDASGDASGGVLPGPSSADAGGADPLGGLGDLLGSVLGGGGAGSGGGLDDLLGGVLGGMLGGGKR